MVGLGERRPHRHRQLLRVEQAPTRQYGSKPIIVLDVDGTERSVWLTATALTSKFADELEARGARGFNKGERITVTRGEEKKTSGNDRAYWPFQVRFHDAPERDAASILGAYIADDDAPAAETPSAQLSDDDNLPF